MRENEKKLKNDKNLGKMKLRNCAICLPTQITHVKRYQSAEISMIKKFTTWSIPRFKESLQSENENTAQMANEGILHQKHFPSMPLAFFINLLSFSIIFREFPGRMKKRKRLRFTLFVCNKKADENDLSQRSSVVKDGRFEFSLGCEVSEIWRIFLVCLF